MRVTILAVCAAVALGFAGCGGDSDDDDDDGGGAPAAQTQTAPAQDGGPATTAPSAAANGGLGADRYAKVDALLQAGVAIDGITGRGSDTSLDELVRGAQPYMRACEALDGDAQLEAVAEACGTEFDFLEDLQAYSQCRPNSDCEALGDITETLAEQVRASRAADTAIRAAGLSDACEAALVTPPEGYEDLADIRRGFAIVEGLVGGQDEEAARTGLEQAQRLFEGAVRVKAPEVLRAFRAGCG